MIKVVISGGIASGKSLVSSQLEKWGARVIDADIISRELVCPGSVATIKIKEKFGEEFFTPSGELLRKKLGQVVFYDKSKLNELNAIMHPLIKEEIINRVNNYHGNLVFVVIPLLIELGIKDFFDYIWIIKSSKKLRIKRAAARDNISKEYAKTILSRQKPQKMLDKIADKVFINDGEPGKLIAEVEAEYQKLISLANSIEK